MKLLAWVLGTGVVVGAWAQTNAPAPGGPPPSAPGGGAVQGFVVPEYDDRGQLKWRLFGDTARLELAGGKVAVQGMKIELYREQAVNITVLSPVCLFDRTAKQATSGEEVQILSTNLVVTGQGFEWSATDSQMRILSNVTVRIANRKTAAFPRVGPEPK